MAVATLTATWAFDKDGVHGWHVKINGLSDRQREEFKKQFPGKVKEQDLEEGVTLIITPKEEPSFRRTDGFITDNILPMPIITQYLNALDDMYFRIMASHSVFAPKENESTTIWTLQRR